MFQQEVQIWQSFKWKSLEVIQGAVTVIERKVGGIHTFVGGAGADYLKADSSLFAIMFPLHGLFGEISTNKVYLLTKTSSQYIYCNI